MCIENNNKNILSLIFTYVFMLIDVGVLNKNPRYKQDNMNFIL